MLLRSVVGKLWTTIIVLVSLILIILTFMLAQFFEKHYIDAYQAKLTEDVKRIAYILTTYEDTDTLKDVSWQLIDPFTRLVIVDEDKEFFYSTESTALEKINGRFLLTDSVLRRAYENGEEVHKKVRIPGIKKHNELSDDYLIVGVPLDSNNPEKGALYMYRSLIIVKNTMNETMKMIILSAGIAIILTTIFAFFLSSRITAPLRKMRQVAFEVSRGQFDTKVPILTNDEIGELATAFNQMAKQLKTNMDALREEKEQLSSILRSMVDGVLMFSRSGEVSVLNAPAERFLQAWYYEQGVNVTNEEVLPKEIYDLFATVVNTEHEQFSEIHFQGRTWIVLMTPLYGINESVRGAVAVVREVTNERKTDKLRKDFIANVSHELRTPIAMLQGYSEAIVDGFAVTEEEIKELAQIIHDESLRMGRLVNDLLDLGKMEAGHLELNVHEVPLVSFVERSVGKFAGIGRENDVPVVPLIDSKLTEFPFDEDRMEQVLTNLISNAIRHTKEGQITVHVQQTASSLLFTVKDTGTGIPEEDLPFVFERFYKADKARTRGKAGTGLGLAIVKNIVEAHEGTIQVYSKYGEGTAFAVTLFLEKTKQKINKMT